LGQVTPTSGQIVIGFATRAGETANDGYGNISPYAKALANRLKERDDIRNILGKVALDVSKKYNQYPIYKANLAYSVFLNKANSITIVDGLMYQNQLFNKRYSFQEAQNYCNKLTLSGYTHWRLPNINELEKLLIKNKNKNYYSYSIRKEFVKNILDISYPFFWSSTSISSNKLIQGVNFNVHFLKKSGYIIPSYGSPKSKNFALCVHDIN